MLVAVSASGQPSNTFQFSTNAFTVAENTPGFATVTVLFGGGNTSNVTVDYFTSDDTAFAGVDYTATGGSLVFTPDQLTNSFSVIVGDDFIGQGNRQFFVNLGASTPGTSVGALGSASVTILDNEIPQPPANDPFTNATGIFGLSGLTPPATNNAASKEAGEPNHAGNAGGRSVWFRWTAPANGTVTFSTASNTFDTLLAVYTGSSVNALIPVADDDGAGTNSTVTFTAVAGTVYRIAVDGAGGAEGTYQLRWSVAGSAGNFRFTSAFFECSPFENFGPVWPSGLQRTFVGTRVTVTREGAAFGRVVVNYRVSNGVGTNGATIGEDFNVDTGDTNQVPDAGGFNGTLVFDHLQNSASFFVNISPDTSIVNQTVGLNITSVSLATGESGDLLPPTVDTVLGSSTLLVLENRSGGVFWERTRMRAGENSGTVRVRLWRGAAVPDNSTTRVRLSENTFLLDMGADYANPVVDPSRPADFGPIDQALFNVPADNFFTPVDVQFVWDAGQGFQDFRFTVTNDSLVEFSEDIGLIIVGGSAPVSGVRNLYLTVVHEDQVDAEHAPGSVDPAYNRDFFLGTTPPNNATPGANNNVNAVAVQDDQRTVIVGEFTAVNTVGRNRIARMNTDGSLDTGFNPGTGANSSINTLLLQPNQQILIGGNFSSYNGTLRGRVARVNTNGTLDVTFNPGAGANGVVRALALHSDTNHPGKVVVVGDFSLFAGNPYNRLARLNPDGTVDNTFNIGTGPDGTVLAVKIQDNGQILIGGNFNSFNGQPASRIARLNPDGSLDETFKPGAGIDGPIHALELEPGLAPLDAPKVVIAGEFTQVDLHPRNRLARLNADGSLDTSFDPGFGADDTVFALARQGDNTFLIGGLFHNYNGTRRLGLARVLNNGWLDTTFMDAAYNQFAGFPTRFSPLVEPKNFVRSIAVETNGNVMVGGSFKRVGGGGRNTAAFGPASPWGANVTTPPWIARDDYRNRFNFARIIGGAIPGAGHITFTQSDYAIDETAGFTYIQLARTNGQLAAAGAQFRTGDRPPALGAASAPTDYTSTPSLPVWTTTWSATRMRSDSRQGLNNLTGPTADDIYISINDDTEVEGNEVFDMTLDLPQTFLTLGGEVIPVGAALGQTRATLTIVDDDVPPAVISFATNSFTVNEADGTAELTVLRSGNVNLTVTVDFFTADGTAIDTQDYTGQFGQITFGTGETEKTFQVPIINDVNAEFDETISLSLTNLTAGAVFGTGGQNSTLTIFDNDFATGQLRFSSAVYPATESDGVVSVVVQRTGGNAGAITVDLATLAGSAIPGTDFNNVATTLNWADGDTSSRTVHIPVLADGLVDGAKAFTVGLTNARVLATSAPVPIAGANPAAVAIADADAFGVLQFASANFSVSESGGQAIITVTRTGGNSGTVQVNYQTSAGSALPGVDYLNTNGTLILGPGISSATFALAILDNALQNTNVNGSFNRTVVLDLSTFINGSGGNPVTAVLTIVDDERFNEPAGSVDTTYNGSAGANETIYSLALQPDGRLLIGGEFTSFNGLGRTRIARLDKNGLLDPTFDPGPGASGTVRALALQDDGRILVGGIFTNLDGVVRNRIGRLNHDGSLDEAYDPGAGADNPVYAIALHRDSAHLGKAIVGGAFATMDGVSRPFIARLNANGTVDLGFNPGTGANGTVFAVAIQNDGRILVGGDFTTFNGVPSAGIVRLNADGSVDAAFAAALGTGANASVRSIVVQSDGRILLGGLFTDVDGTPLNNLARLLATGAVDPSFTPGEGGDEAVLALALQPDGKILVAGDFQNFSGVTRSRLTRLLPDGTVDTTINFGTGADAFIAAIAVQLDDNKIIVGGGFTAFNDLPRNRLARLHGGVIAGPGRLEFRRPVFSGNEQGTNVIVFVRRLGGLTGAVGVDVSTASGTALAGVDFTNVLTNLSFPSGEGLRRVLVPVVSDTEPEGNELFNLALANITGGATAGPQPTATAVIVDDDGLFFFSSPVFNVSENIVTGQAQITVRRTAGTNAVASVELTSADLTARDGEDYLGVTNVVITFQPGQTTRSVSIPILDDDLGEGNESAGLSLSNPVGGSLGTPASATLTIVENEFSPGILQFSQVAYQVDERGGSAVINVERLSGTSGLVSAQFIVNGITATPGLDYVATAGSVSFSDGETSKTFEVPILDDFLIESDELIELILTNATGSATLGSNKVATLTILDSEVSLYFTGAGARLVADPNGNGVIDAGETVTVSLAVRNTGTTNSVALFGSLLPTNGVAAPSASQNYGAVLASGPSVARDFTFTAGTSNGAIMTAILQLQDGAQNFGNVPFVFQIGTRTNKALNSGLITILDDGPAQPYPSVITVSGEPGTLTKVSVTVSNLSHDFPRDIDMLLVSPTGQRVIILSDAGGSAAAPNAINNVTLKFDDAAPAVLGQTNQIVSGTYRPTNYSPAEFFPPPAPTNGYASTLAAFNGINPNGDWLLYILDDDFLASGSIASGWSLEFVMAADVVNPPGDLRLSGSSTPSPAVTGTLVTYTLAVTNAGSAVANNVVLSNTLPAGLAYSSVVNPHGGQFLSGNHAVLQLGTLGIGATKSVTIVASTTGTGTVTDLAGVTSSLSDSVPADNNLAIQTTVITAPALTQRLVGSSLVMSWPIAASNFIVVFTDSLTPPVDWQPLGVAPTVAGSEFQVVIPVDPAAPTRFYTLRQSP